MPAVNRLRKFPKKQLPNVTDKGTCGTCAFFIDRERGPKGCGCIETNTKYDTRGISSTTYCEHFCLNGYKCDKCKNILLHEKENIFFTQFNMEYGGIIVGTYCEGCLTDYIVEMCKKPQHNVSVHGVRALLKK
jgi:hypothetical protein